MKYLKEAMPYIIILIVVILIRTFIVTPIKVNGQSMYNTLSGNEIMILWRTKDIKRYDIVVADLMEEGKKTDTLIKRVYGLPGETISCEDGIIYVNGKKIDDSYAYGKTNDFETVTLGSDEYFLLGDNREVSLDSRIFGPISKKYIDGKTDFIIWPFTKFGQVKK